MSLLIRRDATLRSSGALHPGIFEQPGNNRQLLIIQQGGHDFFVGL
jgi:hypothetical protein